MKQICRYCTFKQINRMGARRMMTGLLAGLSLLVWLLIAYQPVFAQESTDLLHIYALALDNSPFEEGNLESQYDVVLDHFVDATTNAPGHTVVAMIDLHNADAPEILDQIVVIKNGEVQPLLLAVPQADGSLLEQDNYEYDMVSPWMVGGFIKWARTTYPATHTLFSFVGHGTFNPSFTRILETSIPLPTASPTPLGTLVPGGMPDADAAIVATPTPLPPRFALPWFVTVGSNYTDEVTQSGDPESITPQILAEMLMIGTDDGEQLLDVVDLVHCFSGSAEQYHELAPYSKMIIGSPNYNYISADAFGRVIESTTISMDSETLASTIVDVYATVLDEADEDWEAFGYEHPYVFSAVSSAEMSAVKTSVDALADAVIEVWDSDDTSSMTTRLESVQANNTVYYDTSLCTDPFVLNASDALLDIGTFSDAMRDEFSDQPGLIAALDDMDASVASAIVAYRAQNGRPWFAGDEAQQWTLTNDAAVGMSLFVGLGAEKTENKYRRPWQLEWLTPYQTPGELSWLSPYEETNSRGIVWAHIIERYWQAKKNGGADLQLSDLCFPELEIVQEQGEIAAEEIIVNQFGTPFAMQPIKISGIISVSEPLLSALTTFRVLAPDNTELFSTTVSTTALKMGKHLVEASDTWTATDGAYRIEMVVDANNHIIEQNESDNEIEDDMTVYPVGGIVSAEFNEEQFISTDTSVDFSYQSTLADASAAKWIVCEIYQLVPQSSPLVTIPQFNNMSLHETTSGESVTCEMAENSLPGAYMATITLSGVENPLGSSSKSAIFNYMPPFAQLRPDEAHTFIFPATTGDDFTIYTQAAQLVETFLWEPGLAYPTRRINGVDTTYTTAQTDGMFTVSVNNPCESEQLYALNTYATQLNSTRRRSVDECNSLTLAVAVRDVTAAPHWLSFWVIIIILCSGTMLARNGRLLKE